MNTVTHLNELFGKTIKIAAPCGYGDGVVLAFEDDSLIVFKVERGYDGDASVEIDKGGLDLNDQLHIGVITKEEYDKQMAIETVKRKEKDLQRKRQMLQQLKKELGEEN